MQTSIAQMLLLMFAFTAIADRAVGQDAPAGGPENGGMERGEAGASPPGWFCASQVGAKATIDPVDAFAGQQSTLLDASTLSGSGQRFSNLMQSIDAAPWRGERVRLRGAVKVAELARGAKVQLWMRVDRPEDDDGNRQPGAFDNMGDRPIEDAAWTQHDIVLDVADDAERIALGMFVIGEGKAWLDDVSLTVVAKDDVAATGSAAASGGSRISPAVRKALAAAADAPQQPFFTGWLYLPLFTVSVFMFALWPRRGDTRPSVAEAATPPPQPGAARWFAICFTIAYWLLYCLPRPFARLVPSAGQHLRTAHEWIDDQLVTLTARVAFGIDGELVPPNGSGDTTFNYISVFNGLVFAVVSAAALTIYCRRRFDHAVLLDLLRSYLRYVLAFAMLGYGLAKVAMEHNQFPIIGEWQLSKTWGDSSPMNVVWSFMGASRPYTIFAGLSEVLGALLLIWRRTATLGAIVTAGVMTNVALINFCYDVPVKLYSSHLLLMAILIVVPDVPRLFRVLVRNRAVGAAERANAWRGKSLRWVRLVLKSAIILYGFAWPVGQQAWEYGQLWTADPATADGPATEAATDENDQPMLTRRGYRWINEVPFNR